MKMILHAFLLLICSSYSLLTSAQSMTGSWEGLTSDEYMRIEIIQDGKEICGYTYDVVVKRKESNCKAYFKGKLDEKTGIWTLKGISFIKNSGDHVLMTIKLWFGIPGDKNMLRGAIITTPKLPGILDEFMNELFWLRRVSATPKKPSTFLPLCYTPITSDKPLTKPTKKTPLPTIEKKDSLNTKTTTDTTKIPPTLPVTKTEVPLKKTTVPSKEFQEKLKEMQSRKKGEVKNVVVKEKKVQIKLFDNGTIDNDSVSIFYNGEILKINERLTDNPIIINLVLDDNTDIHEIVMFAENLGLIAPNTATLVITAGKNRYELHASADFNSNSTIRLVYEP